MSLLPLKDFSESKFKDRKTIPVDDLSSPLDNYPVEVKSRSVSGWGRPFDIGFLCLLGAGLLFLIFLYWAG